jgi:formate dehydrogenase subunit gamma
VGRSLERRHRVADVIERFDRTERAVHWVNTALFLTLMATGAILYIGELAALVGRRELVKTVHVFAGLALPIPILVALVRRSGAKFRADVKTLSRWIRDDRWWLHRRTRHRAQLGKFNPGQKLNATFVGAAIVVMLASGSIMFWFQYFSDDWRTGATFVHDWFAFFIWLSVIGHIGFALSDRGALNAMLHGSVSDAWAREKRPRWYGESIEADGVGDAEIPSGERATPR